MTAANGQFDQGVPSSAIDQNDPDRLMVVDTGLYVTSNGGKDWQCGHAHPAENGKEQSGLYHSSDGGEHWTLLARKGPEHFGAFLSPTHPGWIYMTLTEDAPGAGLWLSRDYGATWKPMSGLPFANAQRITFDSANPDQIYVTTFGGSVWRGSDE